MVSRYCISVLLAACFFPAFTEVPGQVQYPIRREDLAVYADAKTALDASPEELFERYPELKKTLSFTRDQEKLGPLLQHVGERVADFFRTFKDTSSAEEVLQQMTDRRGYGKTIHSRFMYLMLADPGKDYTIEEYRGDDNGKPLDLLGSEGGFLLASRLLGQLRFFLPRMQPESGFRYLGTTSNPNAHVIAFAQKPEHPTTVGTLMTPNGQKILLYQGLVWIDAGTYQVLRMKSDLLAPRTDIWLDRQTTDIEFQEVRFSDERTLWLPREVRVEAVYMHTTYRNRHRYSDYKRFTVESRDEIKRPKVPPAGSESSSSTSGIAPRSSPAHGAGRMGL